MPLVLPTPTEYAHHLSHYQRAQAVRRLFVATEQLDEHILDVAHRIYARLDRDSLEVIAARREVLATQYAPPRPGWRRHHRRNTDD